MIRNLKGIYSYFIFAGIFLFLLSLIFFFVTRKYKKSRIKILALLSSLNKRTIILVSTFILNFTLVAFFAISSKNYNDFVMYMILINSGISIIVSLNIRMIISTVLYTFISIFSLKIINLVYNYLSSIHFDRLTFILGMIFVLMVIIYELFVTVRLLEIVLKKNGGVKFDGKSRKPKEQ